ncbi:MAG: BatA domain-containing protein, partial [Planctomycetaceae bacterium]|nr:BatA domain-containing protein [Planctomycetaceae bacterium]
MDLVTLGFPPSLFAFALGEPLLLWGLLLLAVPWLLHLLTKRQYRSTEWAAMRFLLEAMRKNSRRIRIEQLILLLVRTALLGLIVFGLARPLWTSAGPLLGGFEPVQRILVIDASYSMGFEQSGTTLFSHAQSLARELIGKARQGDAFQLVRLADGGTTTIISEPSFRKED